MKIAVCDGDVKACREIRRMLDRYGEKERVFLETELFSESGALCQEAEAGKRYDLIFLEVRPKSGGTELCCSIPLCLLFSGLLAAYLNGRQRQAKDKPEDKHDPGISPEIIRQTTDHCP